MPQCIEQQELKAERGKQARETISSENGRLCATPFGVDVVGITEVVALTGALVGGATLSRARGLIAPHPTLPYPSSCAAIKLSRSPASMTCHEELEAPAIGVLQTTCSEAGMYFPA